MSDLTGQVIDGRYELCSLIASGGMASIYEALDLRLDRKVAVKIMHSHLAEDEKFVSRFIREAKAAAALSHPNIVAVQDQGWNQSGVPAVFLVMELVEGHTLREYLFERGALSTAETLRFLIPVASALAAAHNLGIVHRDVKPENILISSTGRVKIADFGLAQGELIGSTLTAESSVLLGSVSYLSPEQVQRGVADSRSDVYALGIVAFELLTGEKPFEGETPIQIAYMHVNGSVPAPSSLNPSVPSEFDALVLAATNNDPDKRPRDAEELLQLLIATQKILDPQRPQLSLELDLPHAPIREKSRAPKRATIPVTESPIEKVEDMSTKITKKENTQQVARAKRQQTSNRVRRNRKLAGVVALVAAALVWYFISGVGARIVVPSVVGGNVTQAAAALTPLGLHTAVSERVFSEDIPKGIIIASQPAGGSHVKKDSTVSFVVSKGPERYTVPSLVNLTADAALALLKANSLVAGTVTEIFNPKIAQGLIISSSPVANTSVTRDTSVDLVISKGPQLVALTSYVGKSAEQALNELTDAGFVVNPVYVYSDTVATGAVISQSPDGPLNSPKGTKISLTVSKGSEMVFIPNVYSLTQTAALGLLQDLDLIVTVKSIGNRNVKNVTNITPKVGTQVKRGSTVVITVG